MHYLATAYRDTSSKIELDPMHQQLVSCFDSTQGCIFDTNK